MNVVLLNPEIHVNTGNIGRTCFLTNSELHLIKPLGFELDDKKIKRSGLDYWPKLKLTVWDSFEKFYNDKIRNTNANLYMATTKTNRKYSDVSYNRDDFIMFGPESRGIPETILKEHEKFNVTIPMYNKGRSLNLSNSVAIIVFESFRQRNFDF